MFFNGAVDAIPHDWLLCDGNNGTPDLLDQVIIGASADVGGVPSAFIDGVLQSAGGAQTHSHQFGAGPGYVGTFPSGNFSKTFNTAFSYPPVFALFPILACQGATMESGMIVIWSGSIASIPAGWHLCDGNDGTIDLRDQMIICAVSDSGGVPEANIDGALQSFGGSAGHTHILPPGTTINDIAPGGNRNTVSDPAFNYPPSYALAYIQRL